MTDKITGKPKWLLKIHLETGRHHQIRVQMAHAKMPLAGDRKYGKNSQKTENTAGYTGGLGLCAASLTFSHPTTKKTMKYDTIPETSTFEGFIKMKKI